MSVSAKREAKKLPTISMDNRRIHQERCRQVLGIAPRLTEAEILELALKQAKVYREQSTRQGDFIRIGVFKYPARLEELRWRQTDEVIRRILPGVDEDPKYLAMLARQAASLEIVLSKAHTHSPDPKTSALWQRVFLGTTTDHSANAESYKTGGDALVLLNFGLIDFLYQTAKSVVLSWRPLEPEPNTSGTLGVSIADIEQVLDKNPYPLELLSKTLHAFMFEGRPRAIGYDPPPTEFVPPLTLLTNFTERFVIAHEYGHALWQELNPQYVRPAGISQWADEFNADFFAFFFTFMSVSRISPFPPN